MSRVIGERVASIRGRGSSSNPTNRFEGPEYEPTAELEAESDRPETIYIDDHSKSIVAKNESPDVGFDVSINPYRGCEHGCAYCYARPMHEFLGFSAGLDFETRIMVKHNAPQLLEETLRKPSWVPQTIGLSGATDAYQPVERKLEITRKCLRVLSEFRNPVAIITKNALVTRDIDILSELAEHRAVAVLISITTLDLQLNRRLEPRSSSPQQRLDAVHQLSKAGIPVGVMTAPMIPGLNDHEMPGIIDAAADAGAVYAGYILLRLPLSVAPLFEQWLEKHEPLRKEKVKNRLLSMRDGRLYRSGFQQRMRGEGPFAEQLNHMFMIARRKAGMRESLPSLSAESFRVPLRSGDQLPLV